MTGACTTSDWPLALMVVAFMAFCGFTLWLGKR